MPESEIYKTLIEYIRDDKKDKEKIQDTLTRIELQTTRTNGRVTANENRIKGMEGRIQSIDADIILIKKKNDERVVISRVNWKWVHAIWLPVGFGLGIVADALAHLLKELLVRIFFH